MSIDIPFEEEDSFREVHPAHEPISVGDALGALSRLRPWDSGDDLPPDPKQLQCGKCHKTFTARPVWTFAKWGYSAICNDCGEGNTLPPGFVDDAHRPRTLRLCCPVCGATRGVVPELRYNLWHYEFLCPDPGCGATALNIKRLSRDCETCQETFFVNPTYPSRVCAKCSGQQENPYAKR